jgi:hypothetical protein
MQRIKKIIFTDVCKQKSDSMACANHSQGIQSILLLDMDKTPIGCYKIKKDLEKPDDLEELRKLAIKETKRGDKYITPYPVRLIVLIFIH